MSAVLQGLAATWSAPVSDMKLLRTGVIWLASRKQGKVGQFGQVFMHNRYWGMGA